MRHGGLIAGLVLLLGGLSVASAGAEQAAHERPGAGCVFLPAEHILAVTIKVSPVQVESEAEERPRDGQAYIARSGDQIAVFGGPDATPVACAGGSPTVTNTNFVLVRAGNRVREPELAIDMRRGILAPGFTDERDGTSEVEVFADVGRHGRVVVASTSDPDWVTVGPAGSGDIVNVNAGEAVDDPDVFAQRGAFMVYGGAGGDRLEATPGPSAGAGLIGGGGADLLIGTGEPDLLQGDGGTDLLLAGGSTDVVLGLDRTRDQIDCGAGNDTFVVVDRADRLAGCEKRSFEGLDEPPSQTPAGPQRLLATSAPALATASGITQNDPSPKPWLSIPNAQLKRAR